MEKITKQLTLAQRTSDTAGINEIAIPTDMHPAANAQKRIRGTKGIEAAEWTVKKRVAITAIVTPARASHRPVSGCITSTSVLVLSPLSVDGITSSEGRTTNSATPTTMITLATSVSLLRN
eukprot:CAMPEP_0176418070 /NCGR_PEP_ID=MMETSP0127-20121128/7248_1 /TAXON_ID=938130 /ORGANISM="Platyophrya macrostoma, Strain WH" /LENGTH=120 /DNA_ID=CAMNT_0017798317 /DNA_START=280 /DNA_END=639 /DNA_ORIENTATION=+